jgi:hypothetical protein
MKVTALIPDDLIEEAIGGIVNHRKFDHCSKGLHGKTKIVSNHPKNQETAFII